MGQNKIADNTGPGVALDRQTVAHLTLILILLKIISGCTKPVNASDFSYIVE